MTGVPKSTTAFTDEQYDLVYPKGIERHFWCIARNAIISDMVRWIERRAATRIGRMLEIGCGRGMVVEHLRQSGHDCYGVELSPVAVPGVLKEHVWSGVDCLELPEAFRASVQAILLLEVIEHIEDSSRFVSSIRDAFPNCRWLIISVPARMELWSNFDDEYGHFRRYDHATLRRELAQTGAQMVWSRYRFAVLYPIVYALVRARRTRPLSNSTPSFALFHRILAEIIRRETWVLPQWVYGTSIYAVGEFPGRSQDEDASLSDDRPPLA